MTYNEFVDLLQSRNITLNRASRDLCISRPAISQWKHRGAVPLYAEHYARSHTASPRRFLRAFAILTKAIDPQGAYAIDSALSSAIRANLAHKALFAKRKEFFIAVNEIERIYAIFIKFAPPFTLQSYTCNKISDLCEITRKVGVYNAKLLDDMISNSEADLD